MKIFDSHFHIINPKYPLVENQGFTPDYFLVEDYKKILADMNLEVVGGAVVSGSFQGYDQTYLVDTLKELGDNFVGVTQLPYEVSDEELICLDKSGVKSLRFNFYRGNTLSVKQFDEFSRRVFDLVGWSTEVYIDAAKLEEDMVSTLIKLPRVSVDHLGMNVNGVDRLKLFAENNIPIRATRFGGIDYTIEQVEKTIKDLYAINPDCLIFGTDLPSTRAKRKFQLSDVKLIQTILDQEGAEKVLYKNGLKWYLGKIE